MVHYQCPVPCGSYPAWPFCKYSSKNWHRYETDGWLSDPNVVLKGKPHSRLGPF